MDLNRCKVTKEMDDFDELSPLPPPPSPQVRLPNIPVIVNHRVHFEDDLEEEEKEEHIRPMPQAPKPHPHPLYTKISSKPKQTMNDYQVYGHRLDHAFLNPEKIAYYTSNEKENISVVSSCNTPKKSTDLSKAQMNSTNAILKQVERVEHLQFKEPELNQEEKTMAAKEAVGLRNEIQYKPNTDKEDTMKPFLRTKARKVPKQIDPKWLKKRSENMRPLGALEREDERDFYETSFKISEVMHKERLKSREKRAMERKKQVEKALDAEIFSNIIDRVSFHRRPEFIYY